MIFYFMRTVKKIVTRRSHDCMSAEIEFAGGSELDQEDVERREKNAGLKRTMYMWKNALKNVWNTRPVK